LENLGVSLNTLKDLTGETNELLKNKKGKDIMKVVFLETLEIE
jgi:hypothetical protein